jgi:hypothetical protein
MTQHSEGFPSRSADGLAALDIFYAEFNEINFYVEDIDQENLYEVILRNLFPAVRIDRIFPLGGKQAVLAHALSVESAGITAFRAYILDKDFDDLLGIQVSHPNVFYLDRFCIENYMLEESAIVEVVTESHPKKRRQDIARDLDISQMVEHLLSSLKPLFICFACVQRFNLGLANCGEAPEKYCEKRRLWEIDQNAFRSYQGLLVKACKEQRLNPPFENPFTDERISDIVAADEHTLVCGKYVVAMLFHYIKSKYILGNITFESFVFRVAKGCSFATLHELGRRISQGADAYRVSMDLQSESMPT